MKAVGRYVVVDPVQGRPQSGELVLSVKDADDIRYRHGDVIAVGDQCSPVLAPGQLVAYDKSAGFRLIVEGRQLLVITDRDICAVLRES